MPLEIVHRTSCLTKLARLAHVLTNVDLDGERSLDLSVTDNSYARARTPSKTARRLRRTEQGSVKRQVNRQRVRKGRGEREKERDLKTDDFEESACVMVGATK